MRDAKLFSGAIFLFLIFVTVGFFQLLKPHPKEPIQFAKSVTLKAFAQDPIPDGKEEEIKVVSSSLHVANVIVLSRHILYLGEILFQREFEFRSHDTRILVSPAPFFKVLLKTLISPNAP